MVMRSPVRLCSNALVGRFASAGLASKFCMLAVIGMSGISSAARAQSTSGQEGQSGSPSNYQVPTGEQPTYGKKYYPGQNVNDIFLEVNPLLLIQRGIGVEFEKRGGDTWSFGADVLYRDAEVFYENDVKGRTQFLALAPKVRIYPVNTLAGVFFGAKIILGQQTNTVAGGGITSEKSAFIVTPAAHVGYRFVAFSGFTIAGYIGGGLNIPKPDFKKEDLKTYPTAASSNSAYKAREKINDQSGLFRPDFGLTLGIAL